MQWVNTRIGMSGHGCSFMGVAVPFGVLPFVPDNFNKGWGWCSGYHDPVRRILYSGLYHVFLQPNLFNDCYGTYRGADGKNYEALGRDTCTIFSLCDTYRTAYPLYTLLQNRMRARSGQYDARIYTQQSIRSYPGILFRRMLKIYQPK